MACQMLQSQMHKTVLIVDHRQTLFFFFFFFLRKWSKERKKDRMDGMSNASKPNAQECIVPCSTVTHNVTLTKQTSTHTHTHTCRRSRKSRRSGSGGHKQSSTKASTSNSNSNHTHGGMQNFIADDDDEYDNMDFDDVSSCEMVTPIRSPAISMDVGQMNEPIDIGIGGDNANGNGKFDSMESQSTTSSVPAGASPYSLLGL